MCLGISGFALPGQILSILGTKRTGKSLLLAVLGHIHQAEHHFDCIKINGKSIDKAFYHLAGYVPTENTFVPNFSIRETLLYSCLLRLPRRYSLIDRFKVVDCLLKQVNLYDIRHQSIDTLKREERKLLALALEIANNPSVLILDDPTVNLDYVTANVILKLLTRLAKAGKTIILTSLNPKPFEFAYFSNILLLYKDERGVAKQAYFGNANSIQTYFSLNHRFISFDDPWFPSLQDYINARKQNLNCIKEAYQASEPLLSEQITMIEKSPQFSIPYEQCNYYSANFVLRFCVLFLRHLIGTNRNIVFFWVRVIQIVSVVLITSLTFWQLGNSAPVDVTKRFSALYFTVLSISFVALFAALYTFTEDTKSMMRERFSKIYGAGTFFYGKSLAEFVSNLPFVLVYGIVVYWMIGLHPSADRFFVFLVVLVSFVSTAQSLGQLVASWSPIYALAQALIPLATSLFLIYSNVSIPIHLIPNYISWLYWISHFHYSIEALLMNEFQGLVFEANGTISLTGEEVLLNRGIGYYNTPLDNVWANILMLIALGIAFRLLAYLGLRVVKKPKRVLPSRLERWCEEF